MRPAAVHLNAPANRAGVAAAAAALVTQQMAAPEDARVYDLSTRIRRRRSRVLHSWRPDFSGDAS
jgi:hypothetical protein